VIVTFAPEVFAAPLSGLPGPPISPRLLEIDDEFVERSLQLPTKCIVSINQASRRAAESQSAVASTFAGGT
jgi:hypothetical protein